MMVLRTIRLKGYEVIRLGDWIKKGDDLNGHRLLYGDGVD